MALTLEQKQKAAEDRATVFGNDPEELRANLSTTATSRVREGSGREGRTRTITTTKLRGKGKAQYNQAQFDFENRGGNRSEVTAQNRGAGGGSGISKADFSPGAISVGGVNTFTPVNSKKGGR